MAIFPMVIIKALRTWNMKLPGKPRYHALSFYWMKMSHGRINMKSKERNGKKSIDCAVNFRKNIVLAFSKMQMN